MWVQVPPLASSRRGAPAAFRLALLVVALLAAACSRFADPIALGPPDAAVGRPDGPAAAVVASGGRAVVAWASTSAGGDVLMTADLGAADASSLRPSALPRPAPWLLHPPSGAEDATGAVAFVWRETAPASPGRLLWTESPQAPGGFSEPAVLPGEYGSDPRVGGTPATAITLEGRPPGPRAPEDASLAVWQRDRTDPSGWSSLAAPLRGRPVGFDVLGLDTGAAIAAVQSPAGRVVLARVAAGEDPVRTTMAAQPLGPGWVWLAGVGPAAVAAWSERLAGLAGPISVRWARSADGGRTWTKPEGLATVRDGTHPLPSFASDGATVAAVWGASDSLVDRIRLAVSRDGGVTFGPSIAVDSGESGVDRSRPRVALRGPRILVAWQERSAAPENAIYAALADELGATLPVPATRLDATPDGREPRNPQPWLQADGTGGVLWESRAQRSRERLPIPSAEPERTLVSLHLRRLRR